MKFGHLFFFIHSVYDRISLAITALGEVNVTFATVAPEDPSYDDTLDKIVLVGSAAHAICNGFIVDNAEPLACDSVRRTIRQP